jgi:DNA mismatch endonuclease Vsr
MAAIRSKDTKPEILVRRLLHGMGFRFRLHQDLPGRPDIVLSGRRTIVEVRGCFWHRHSGCQFAAMPATRQGYWRTKFDQNVARDAANLARLAEAGWKVLVIWECETSDPDLSSRLQEFLGPTRRAMRHEP